VSDALSGVVVAACNGVAASVVGDAVECDVPLSPGRNSVVLHALDAAGNAMSAGVTLMRSGTATALRITPATRTLLVDEVADLTVVDDFGMPASSATWSSSDVSVATVDATGRVTAVAEGTATVTANAGILSATASVTVVSGTSLPAGTSRWGMPSASGFFMQSPVYTHRIGTGPDVFVVEQDNDFLAPPSLRALAAEGETLWIEAAPGAPRFGDSHGGVVTEVRNAEGDSVGLARLGPPGTLPWRYESRGGPGSAAQAADGTIYLVERVMGATAQGGTVLDTFIVVIDGATGAVRARLPQPRSIFTTTYTQQPGGGSTCTDSQSEQSAALSDPIVGLDGVAIILVRHLNRTQRRLCGTSGGRHDTDDRLTLLRVDAAGVTSEQILFRQQLVDTFNDCAPAQPESPIRHARRFGRSAGEVCRDEPLWSRPAHTHPRGCRRHASRFQPIWPRLSSLRRFP
jgi:hypothetical protein